MDAETGQVLFEKNADIKRPPASTTKIMTAILLLENTQPTDVLTASKMAAATGGSSLNLKAGEKVSARDMLYALMLRSANDGCVVVAEKVSGSEKKFAELMTQKAHEIGAANTKFCNCNGLNENESRNLTTARDLAIMARYASKYPEFNAATHSKYFKIARNKENKDTLLKNHAKFLWQFPGADGIKTGYTNPAGHCFVGGATVKGWRLISVVLNSPDWTKETAALMKYGFKNFEQRKAVEASLPVGNAPVKGGVQASVPVEARDGIKFVSIQGSQPVVEMRPNFETVVAPAPAGAPAGFVEAWSEGRMIGRSPLVTRMPVEKAKVTSSGFNGGWLIAAAVVGMVLLGYGSSIAKTARIRRYRLKALLRDTNSRGPGIR